MKCIMVLMAMVILSGCSVQIVNKKNCYVRMQEVIREIDRQIQGPEHILRVTGPRTRWEKVVDECVK